MAIKTFADWAWDDFQAHVEDDIRIGAFPVIEGLISQQLSECLSVQFDGQEGTLLLAGNEQQQLLSPDEAYALCEFLIEQRGTLYEMKHRQFYSKYQ